MITSVTFDDTIPYTVDRRASRFTVDDGWVIAEIEYGRVGLAHADYGCITVQSMPYTLAETLAKDTPLPLDQASVEAEAKSLGQQQSGKKRGR